MDHHGPTSQAKGHLEVCAIHAETTVIKGEVLSLAFGPTLAASAHRYGIVLPSKRFHKAGHQNETNQPNQSYNKIELTV